MENNQLNITDSGKNLDFRTGKLPDLPSQANGTHAGVITSPGDYFFRKYQEMESVMYPYDGMLVSYSISEGFILFDENVATTIGGQKVQGELKLESNLKSLGINTKKAYSPSELSETLKMLRVLFGDKDQWLAIVTNLKNFTAEATAKIEKENDDKGNKKDNLIQTLKTSFDLSFNLSAAIFGGFLDKETFKVEILVNVRSSALEMYLQSVELKEIMDGAASNIITKELEKYDNLIPIIQLS
jgi:hypothetical protein